MNIRQRPQPLPRLLAYPLAALLLSVSSGCVLAPQEIGDERRALEDAGKTYRPPFEDRVLPELPAQPTWREVLHRALLANGELEAAYFDWAAAIHRVEQAGAYPNTPLSLSFESMISGGGMSAFDRTTVAAGPDAMENLAFPPKVYQAAKVALEDARAARERFTAARFALQRQVLTAWADYALTAEKVRIQRANQSLLKLVTDTAADRVRAGAAQQDLLRAEVEYRLLEDELRSMESELSQMRAMLNAILAREPEAPLPPPAERFSRPLIGEDTDVLAAAAEHNPELAALAHEVHGRADALELARLQHIPDFNPFAGFTGSVAQFVGLGVSIPINLPEIRGRVREARAELGRMSAMYRQAKFGRAAQAVAALYVIRNAERQAELFRDRIAPAADRIVENARQGYSAGMGSFLDLIDSQRTLLDVRLALAEANTTREKGVADLEALLGVEIENIPQALHASEQTDHAPASPRPADEAAGAEPHDD